MLNWFEGECMVSIHNINKYYPRTKYMTPNIINIVILIKITVH